MAKDETDGQPDGKIVGREYDVFISYAHSDEGPDDRGPARQLAEWLAAANYTVWWDKSLIPGQDWPSELGVKVEASRKTIALWSKRSVESFWCKHEWVIARNLGTLVPIMIEECEPPNDISSVVGSIHRISIDAPDARQKIIAALDLPPSGRAEASRGKDDQRVSIGALPTGVGRLIGRDIELTRLNAAWASTTPGAPADKKTNVVVLHAIGGAGKTALMRRFVDDLADQGFPGAAKVFGWSAYSQGSGEDRNVDADKFLSDALRHFGHDVDSKPIKDPLEKGRTLARLVKAGRNLLILDGLEPLQQPPGVNRGYLKDRGVAALIKELAADNRGLLVITSRQELPELEGAGPPRVINSALEALDPKAGAQLLRELGAWGTQAELEKAAEEVEGHALSLSLLGTYLDTVHAGDVRKRDHFHFAQAVAGAAKEGDRKARRAQHVMAKYVERFAELKGVTKGEGQTEIAILRVVGLFDRPAPKEALDALLEPPAIAGLTGAFQGLSDHERAGRWAWAVRRLRALKLLNREDDRDPGALDAHPVVREHFSAELKATAPDAHSAAHSRLYDYYRYKDLPPEFNAPIAYAALAIVAAFPENRIANRRALAEGHDPGGDIPPALRSASPETRKEAAALISTPAFNAALKAFLPEDEAGMQPCFAAVTHGCAAGRQEEAWAEVYRPRISRGNANFAAKKLGLYGAELAAIAQFFDVPFGTPSPRLSTARQALVLGLAGFGLRAIGRLAEAVEPFAANVKLNANALIPTNHTWGEAARNASNLSELLLTVGRVAEAERAGADGITYADRSGDAFQRQSKRATHADALHQAGEVTRAATLFAEAERMQAERQPSLPRLYSLPGYRYCDLLLNQGRPTELLERYDYLVSVRQDGDSLLDRALEEMLAGRARAALATGDGADDHADRATHYLDDAVARLIESNNEDDIPRGFLARAAHRRWLYATTTDPAHLAGADQDLKDAEEIARRDEPNGGAMRLYLTDIALERCRLCLAQLPQAPAPQAPARLPQMPAQEKPKPPGRWDMWAWLSRAKTPEPPAAPPAPAPRPALSPQHRELIALAERHWQAAAKLVEETGYHLRDPELYLLRGELDLLDGDRASARDAIRAAMRKIEEGFYIHIPELKRLVALGAFTELQADVARVEAARRQFDAEADERWLAHERYAQELQQRQRTEQQGSSDMPEVTDEMLDVMLADKDAREVMEALLKQNDIDQPIDQVSREILKAAAGAIVKHAREQRGET